MAFGLKKEVQARNEMNDIKEKLNELMAKKKILESKEATLKDKLESLEKKNSEKLKADQERRVREIDSIKFQETQLTKLLRTLQDTSMKT